MTASPRGRIKTGKASLVGGMAVAVAAFVLWTVITRELGADSMPWLVTGLVVSAGIGAWIRIADL
jgi:NAD/NADP transhydrogenase beta subunit